MRNLVTDAKRSVYVDVLVDSGIERSFAEELESDESVEAFVKLPGWFKIPTPLGNYNPDWALVTEPSGGQRLYFVVETKGDLFGDELRGSENAKIVCGAAHFDAISSGRDGVDYVVATKFEDLRADTAHA